MRPCSLVRPSVASGPDLGPDTGEVVYFPDGTITVDAQIAEGEFVATRWTGRGTNTGELMGMPPTGKQVTVEGITYSRIADGKTREAWLIWDTLSMMQQLGAVPEAAPARTT
jgi:predicted ester cyclase